MDVLTSTHLRMRTRRRASLHQVIDYLREHTEQLAPEYEAMINLWLSRIEATDQLPRDPEHDTDGDEPHEPNDYDYESQREK